MEREEEAKIEEEEAGTGGEGRAARRAGEEWEWAPGPRPGIVSAPVAARSCPTAREFPASRPPALAAVPP